jgi:hypothetical protein
MTCADAVHFFALLALLHGRTDARLKQDANAEKNDIKLLLLGAGESGKTTVKTQMRYIEGQPLSDEEKEQFSKPLHSHVIWSRDHFTPS